MKKSLLLTLAGSSAIAVSASAQFTITEIYAGVDGPDLTEDWFELTNTSGSTASTSGLFYDDDSADPTENTPLGTLSVAPNESVIFLVDVSNGDLAAESADFVANWGVSPQISNVPGGSGLSGGGDGVFLFDGNMIGAATVDSLTYPDTSGNGDGFRTYFFNPDTSSPGWSQDGQDGAFESVNTSGDDGLLTVGSPGVIPEPEFYGVLFGAFALAFAAVRRRRA